MYEFLRFLSFFFVGSYVALLYYFQCNMWESILITLIVGFIIYMIVTLTFKDMYLETLMTQNGLPNVFENIDKCHDPGKNYFGHSTTYGEIISTGVGTIADISRTEGIKVFMDMGSGIGKSVVIARLYGFERCIGIEIVEKRHYQALRVLRQLPARISNDIELYNQDIFDFDFSSIKEPISIFASNILWSKETTKDMFAMIAKRCKPRTLVFVSSFDFHDGDLDRFYKYTVVSIPMSWDWQSICYVYQLL